MLKTIKTEVRIDLDDVRLVERRGRSVEGWCSSCGETVILVTAEDAAMLAGLDARSVYRLIESLEIHWGEKPDGLLLVCLRSILDSTARRP